MPADGEARILRGDVSAAPQVEAPGLPEEVAKAALWLCSSDASYTYGHALAVDGATWRDDIDDHSDFLLRITEEKWYGRLPPRER